MSETTIVELTANVYVAKRPDGKFATILELGPFEHEGYAAQMAGRVNELLDQLRPLQ